MASERLEKIYDIKEIGGEVVLSMLNRLNQSFADIRRTKQGLNKDNLKASFDGDTEAARKAKEQLDALRLKEYELRIERQQLINQGKQRQLLAQQELQQQKQIAAGNESVAGSYYDISKRYRELSQVAKSVIPLSDPAQVKQAQDELNRLKVQLDNFNRGLTPDGTLVGEYSRGIAKAFKDMGLDDIIRRQVTGAKAQLDLLDKEFAQITSELRQVQAAGQGSLDSLERQLIENRQAAAQLQGQIGNIERELRGVGGIGQQITNELKNQFKTLGTQVSQLVINYIGLQAAMNAVREGVMGAKELSDQTTALEIELGKAAGGAASLVNNLSELDTRTKLSGLEEIANIAARAGVSEQNLVGVSQSIDKIKIAFGKDFGDVETGTETLVKLINIFEGADNVTGENLLRTGNAIRTLANESVASVPFLNDFAQRMAGLKGISDITLPSVLGLASGFEQYGQSAEVSSTALVRIIPKLAEDTEKFGKIAGLTSKQFADLLNSHPEEALLRVSEGLVKGKDSIQEISSAFADSELGKGRVTSVLGVLGKNADAFRHSIESAGKAYQDTSNIEDAFTAKNNNLAATLDKVSKKFSDAANNKAFQLTLIVLATLISGLISSLPALLTLITAYGVVWGIANASMIRANVAIAYSNILFKAQYAWLVLSETWTKAYAAALTLYTNRQRAAAAATQLFNTAVKENPLATFLVLLGLVIAAFEVFDGWITSTTDRVKEHAEALGMQADATRIANEQTVEQINKLNILVSVARDVKNSDDTRRQSIRDLIALYPQFNKALNGEVISLQALNQAYREVTRSIRLMAEVQASAQLSAERQKAVLQVTALRQKIQVEASGGDPYRLTTLSGLSDEERSLLLGGFSGNAITNNTSLRDAGNNSVSFQARDKDAISKYLQQIEDQRTQSYKQYVEFAAAKTAELNKFEKNNQDQVKKQMEGSADLTIGERTDFLKSKINDLEEAYKLLKETDTKGQQENITQRQDLQKQLDELDTKKNGKSPSGSYSGARLDGGTKDMLKDAEATTALLKAELEKRKIDGQISESDYYRELNKITQAGIQQKLSSIKSGNAEEKKQRAELQLDSAKATTDMNEKLFAIDEKMATQRLERAKKDANNRLQLALADATATEDEKAQAQLDYDKAELAAQNDFNKTMDILERQYAQKSKETALQRADATLEIERKLAADKIDLNKKTIEQLNIAIDRASAVSNAKENQEYLRQQESIYKNLALSEAKQKKQLQDIEQEHQAKILAIQAATLNMQGGAQDKAFLDGVISFEEYQANVEKINEQIAQNSEEQSKLTFDTWKTAQDALVDTIRSVGEELEKINKSVLQPMFDLYSQRIDNEQKLTESQLDEQKKRELASASTQEEQQAIEDKYEKIKADNAKKYAEERRQIALKELAIESALAAIRAFSEGMKSGGPWIAAAYVALVGAQYIFQRQKIMEQQFADGGALKEVLNGGGQFNGQSHGNGGIRFMFGNMFREVEGQEGYVINKRSMASSRPITVTGTPSQIASAANVVGGGVDFMPGALVRRFEYGGSLGQIVQPPVFQSYISSGNGQFGADIDPLLKVMWGQIDAIKAVNQRIDRLQVTVSAKTMSDQQNTNRKAVSVGTL